jgi:hypothetical protein
MAQQNESNLFLEALDSLEKEGKLDSDRKGEILFSISGNPSVDSFRQVAADTDEFQDLSSIVELKIEELQKKTKQNKPAIINLSFEEDEHLSSQENHLHKQVPLTSSKTSSSFVELTDEDDISFSWSSSDSSPSSKKRPFFLLDKTKEELALERC